MHQSQSLNQHPSQPDSRPERRSHHHRRRLARHQLTSLDLRIHEHLLSHRVLTTTQLVQLTQSPERTVRYRLQGLRRSGHVGRTRPAAESGSAPAHWWLTTRGRRAVSAAAPPSTTPKPLFMAHAVATADLYVALARLAADSGIEVKAWLRDEESWEEWRSHRGRGAVCPDALLEAQLDVDGALGEAHAFIEIDLGTTTQARLQAKVQRYRQYLGEAAWQELHPHPPLLLILTISEARASTFLRHQRRKAAPYWSGDSEHDDLDEAAVAVCSEVRHPEAAVLAPVWRRSAEATPRRLADLMAAAVRRQRREEAEAATAVAAEAAREAREAPGRATRVLLRELDIDQLRDADAAEAVQVLRGLIQRASPQAEAAWTQAHLPLVLASEAWWREVRSQSPRTARPPQSLVRGLRALRGELWQQEAGRVLALLSSGRSDDRRLPRVVETLASGKLVSGRRINGLADAIDWAAAEQRQRATYDSERFRWVDGRLYGRPWYRRYKTEKAKLEAAWDAEHLGQCGDCLLVRNRALSYGQCDLCGSELLTLGQVSPPAPLDDSLARLQALLGQTSSCVAGRGDAMKGVGKASRLLGDISPLHLSVGRRLSHNVRGHRSPPQPVAAGRRQRRRRRHDEAVHPKQAQRVPRGPRRTRQSAA